MGINTTKNRSSRQCEARQQSTPQQNSNAGRPRISDGARDVRRVAPSHNELVELARSYSIPAITKLRDLMKESNKAAVQLAASVAIFRAGGSSEKT
jgi:hypothetical protein